MLRFQSTMRAAARPAMSLRRTLVVRASRGISAPAAVAGMRPILTSGARSASSMRGGRWLSSEASKEGSEQDGADSKPAQAAAAPKSNEKVVGEAQTHGFKAETRQLLDIVAKSLYQDKEVFVRELISNASDALEKARYLSTANAQSVQDLGSLEVNIYVDPVEKLFTIQDNGVGMTSEELMENLGTIARSGSRAFLNEISQGQSKDDVAKSIIGKFGVGFYSTFMVADKVTVYSKKRGSDKGFCWVSTGDGSYQISEAQGVEDGTKIILHLRSDASEFATDSRVKTAVGKYSSFVSFPVKCNGERVNEVQALWLKDAASITADEHTALYRHIANAYDEPKYSLVYKADAPIDIKSVFYIPGMNVEKMGLGKFPPGVHLYSRRVLIQPSAKDLLPEWLRFVKGVVDSEDLPLSISRESMQDQALLRKLKSVLTRRLVRWLLDEAKRDPAKYKDFYSTYALNIKEGVAAMDPLAGEDLPKLLRYPTTVGEEGELTSLQEYVDRMKPGQDTIYYAVAPSRKAALGSPYYEAFKRGGYEVLLGFNDHDEVVLSNLSKFADKPLKSIETVEPPAAAAAADADKPAEDADGKKAEDKAGDGAAAGAGPKLSAEEGAALVGWLKETLGARVREVEATGRLVDSPAVIAEHESAATRRFLEMAEFKALGITRPGGYKLQVNLGHPLLAALAAARVARPDVASLVAHQVLDNAVMAAGIMDDARDMIPRLSQLMQAALGPKDGTAAAPAADAAPAAEPAAAGEAAK